MFKSRSWFGLSGKPKNKLSLESLKYLHGVLDKNQTASEQNRGLLVESLRCIAEILIWGDQNDGSVFDFFLEKNMLSYFLHIMRQKSGSGFVCVQLLQTLNILFENIKNETSLYYLLSNNHVNSIIVHKFDFSDEDVMAYYILFLKTLSLKLNSHTIHFFYNEHTNDFPLYTEAIKFFNHPESMVRIAVRTISLNVYKVDNDSMQEFIRDRTAAPYFSNLVWFIGKHILELDNCVRNDTDHQSQHKLANLLAEHLDFLHYLNDILLLDITGLNQVLTEHLLHKLFVPLYIYSLTPPTPVTENFSMAVVSLAAVLNKIVDIDEIQDANHPRVSSVVALFLLSLVFLVITHSPLVHALAWVILNADQNVFKEGAAEILKSYIVEKREAVALGFGAPNESLEDALDSNTSTISPSTSRNDSSSSSSSPKTTHKEDSIDSATELSDEMEKVNITDEEKEQILESTILITKSNRPFLDMVLQSLDCAENDYLALLALCLLYALANNKGINTDWLDLVLNKSSSPVAAKYNGILIDKLLGIIHTSSQPSCRVRLITIELTLKLLSQLLGISDQFSSTPSILNDAHKASLLQARSQSMTVLKNFYKSEDIFLDLFEDEYNEMTKSILNVEFLCMDSTILLPPTGTPLTGINFTRRLPCGEVEKARRAIRVFFFIRKMCQSINGDRELLLPLSNPSSCVQIENALDLNNSDLIACTVIMKDGTKYRRFLVIDILQLILVEPDPRRLGWGVAKLVGFLQDVEVAGDKDDSRCLHLTIHRGGATTNRTPILSAKFIFDDHIRSMAAKQRLTKGRTKARQKKMYQIAQLLEIPQLNDSPTPIYTSMLRESRTARLPREHRPLFSTSNRAPGVASALRRDSMPSGSVSRVQMANRAEGHSSRDNRRSSPKGQPTVPINTPKPRDVSKNRSGSNTPRSRDNSPRLARPRSEEIPMEDFRRSQNPSPSSRNSSNAPSRSHTPSRLTTDSSNGILTIAKEVIGPVVIGESNESTLERTNSEETSFIASGIADDKKRVGTIEIV